MRANCVGTTITGQLPFKSYILAKYDGLFPKNYPSLKEYKEARAACNADPTNAAKRRNVERMDKRIASFRQEWLKQQQTSHGKKNR